jgi:hypothetical protein
MSPIPLQVARGTLTLFADLAHRVLDLATWSARALWACAFPVLSLLLGVLGLGAASQGQELLRVMTLDMANATGVQHFVAFHAAAVYWAGTIYLGCYAILLGSPGSSLGVHQPRRYGTEEIYPLVPRVLAMGGLLSLPVWLLRATTDGSAAMFGASLQIAFVYFVFSRLGPARRARTLFGLSLVALLLSSVAYVGTASTLGAISLGLLAYTLEGRRVQVLALLAYLATALFQVGAHDPVFGTYLLSLFIVNVGAFALHSLDVNARARRAELLRLADHPAWRQPLGRPARLFIGGGAAVSVAVFALTAWDSIAIGRAIGAAAVAFFAFGAWSFLASIVLVYLPRRQRMAPGVFSLAVLLLMATAGRSVDNHALRTVDLPAPARPSLTERYPEWLAGADPNAPIYLVATSGGGQRAAWWTAATLATLDARTCGTFSRNTFLISGVSGGSLGAATFAAMLADERPTWPTCTPVDRARVLAMRTEDGGGGGRLGRFLGADFLAPVFASMLLTDAAQLLVPFSVVTHDRAWALERGWERQWKAVFGSDRFAEPLDRLYRGDARVPELVFNATVVEDGARAVFSSVDLDIPGLYDLLGVPGLGSYPLSAVVHATARFPYVGPAASLYRDPVWSSPVHEGGATVVASDLYRRVVDGGYHDNSGADTLIDIVDRLPPEDRARLVLVLITSDPDVRGACSDDTVQWTDRNARDASAWFPELLAPVETASRTQGAHARRSRRQLIERLSCAEPGPGCGCARTIDLAMGDIPNIRAAGRETPAIVPPLGWFLGPQASGELTAAAARMTDPAWIGRGLVPP